MQDKGPRANEADRREHSRLVWPSRRRGRGHYQRGTERCPLPSMTRFVTISKIICTRTSLVSALPGDAARPQAPHQTRDLSHVSAEAARIICDVHTAQRTAGFTIDFQATARTALHSGSALRSGRGGRRFKSCHSDQYLAKTLFSSAPGSAPATERRQKASLVRYFSSAHSRAAGERSWDILRGGVCYSPPRSE